MKVGDKPVSIGGMSVTLMVLINVLVLKLGYTSDAKSFEALIITVPLLFAAIFGFMNEKRYQNNHTRKAKDKITFKSSNLPDHE